MMQVAVWCGICVAATQRQWIGTMLAGCALVLLLTDGYLLPTVAMKPPLPGEVAGPLPGRLREFVHVYYAGHASYYDNIASRKMNLTIFPTAVFLEREGSK